jgi:hypothetical protein
MIRPQHAFLSSLLATCVVVLSFVASSTLRAQATSSSYFMVQGPLGAGGAFETFKFRVEYSGMLTIPGYQPPVGPPQPLVNSGEALLVSIFGNGVTVPSGTYTNSVGTAVVGGGFLSGFQMAGGALTFSGSYPDGPQWGYFAAGGTYVNYFEDPVINGTFDSGVWTQSPVGMSTRYLTDGSFDAWSYGLLTPTDEEDPWGFPIFDNAPPVGVLPTLADFSGPGYMETLISAGGLPYSVYRITAVPEPGRALLFLVGTVALVARRSRKRPV